MAGAARARDERDVVVVDRRVALANTSCSAMAFCDTGSPWFLLSFDDRERAASADGA